MDNDFSDDKAKRIRRAKEAYKDKHTFVGGEEIHYTASNLQLQQILEHVCILIERHGPNVFQSYLNMMK